MTKVKYPIDRSLRFWSCALFMGISLSAVNASDMDEALIKLDLNDEIEGEKKNSLKLVSCLDADIRNLRINKDLSLHLSDSPRSSPRSRFSSPKKPTGPKVRVLSLDGGGVRGLMQTYFLRYLEQETGKSISDMFHFIGGTSIGGIISGILTTPEDGQLAPQNRPAKFSADFAFRYLWNLAEKKVMFSKNLWSCGGYFGPKYKSAPIESALQDTVGNITFDQSRVFTMITTYDIRERCLRVFESWKKETIFKTKDLLLATSAAPTYFAPRRIYPVNVKDHYGYELSDGGTCLNNPSAYITMLAKKNIQDVRGFEIVSLGTGTCLDPLNFNTMKSAGIFKWAPKLVDVFMDGQSSVADEMMSHLFPNDYYRYNPILPRANLRLDDSSSANLSYLIAATDQMIKMNKKSIAELVQELRTPKDDLLLMEPRMDMAKKMDWEEVFEINGIKTES